ncbi:hypothetical protein [Leptospira sarikeiensis]|uniref:Uncharacterized protein n=1 Tax=Leptospira sarikeiensis TaxID=2484943 RepID=A0A4R9K4L4_9LEPT|nr:hypothetical protein [Leptospira sarikeiensis]TGL60458.1 hypothetical protein EHQ64_11490 [Leptospira sarikeiensis]
MNLQSTSNSPKYLIQALPTKKDLIKLGNKSSNQSLGAMVIMEQSELFTSNLNAEMDNVYSVIQENDLCKYIILNYTDMLGLGEAITLGNIEFEGKEYRNVSLRFYLENEIYFIEMKYDLDEYLRRFVTVQVEHFNTSSETILLSYFDKIVNPFPTYFYSEYSVVKMANTLYSKENKALIHFRKYDYQNYGDNQFQRYAKAFRISQVGQDYYFYSSMNSVLINFTDGEQFYPEYINEMERTFAFLSISNGYAGKSTGFHNGAVTFQYYNNDFDLVHVGNIGTLAPDSSSLAIYGWPLKFVLPINSAYNVIYDENQLRFWIDANGNGLFDNGESKLQTDMEPRSQICTCGYDAKFFPAFFTYVPYNTAPFDAVFNFYQNPLFSDFVYVGQNFLNANGSEIKSILDNGVINSGKYDLSGFPTEASPTNVEW